jgi:conjugal transfer/entry exclusion protein
MNTADGLTYRVNQSASKFDALYPSLTGTGLGATMQGMSQQSSALLSQIRVASKTAVRTQSVYEQLCEFQRQNDLALASAQAATGNLQIQQALAQQQALSNEQQATLIAIEAANGRLQAAALMKQVQDEEAARESNARWMAGFGEAGFRGVKEGRGVPLP